MLGAPAAMGCPSPLARRPWPSLRWLRASPFGHGTTGRRVRHRRNALWGARGAEVKLTLLAAEGPSTRAKWFVARAIAPSLEVERGGRESKLHAVSKGAPSASARVIRAHVGSHTLEANVEVAAAALKGPALDQLQHLVVRRHG